MPGIEASTSVALPGRFAETLDSCPPTGQLDFFPGTRQGSDAGQVARPGQANASRTWSAMKNDENFNMLIRHVEGIRCPGQQGGWLRSKSGCPRCPQWVVESPTVDNLSLFRGRFPNGFYSTWGEFNAGILQGIPAFPVSLSLEGVSQMDSILPERLLPAWSSAWSSDANCANCAATAATAANCAARKREHRT